MLRNLNRSYTRGRVCGTPFIGVLGSEIPSSGDNGAGYAYNDLNLPADANKRYRGRIVAWPSAGEFFAYEPTDFVFSGAPDGIYTAQYQLDQWDESGTKTSFDPETITLTVGSANVTGSAAWTEANDTASSVGTVTVSGSSTATEANDSTAGSGAVIVSGTSSTTEADDTLSAAGTVTGGGTGSGWTEANDQVAGEGVVCARAPRGSGYRRPFKNTVRPSSPNTKRTKH